MLYLAIDQHAKQITLCVRDQDGETVLRRQVSTRPEKIEAFFQQLTERDAQFMAILEVCVAVGHDILDFSARVLATFAVRRPSTVHPGAPIGRLGVTCSRFAG